MRLFVWRSVSDGRYFGAMHYFVSAAIIVFAVASVVVNESPLGGAAMVVSAGLLLLAGVVATPRAANHRDVR
ncbi:MAG: hypothetical protein JWP31_2311 [Aeromicrobium sp.]|nr:hypothetical protein [Aeromicrobium sp.]